MSIVHPTDYDYQDDSESVVSRDFSEDFSCEVLNPDVRLKFRKRIRGLKIGAHITFDDPRRKGFVEKGLVLTIRPSVRSSDIRGKLLNKISLDAKEGEFVWSIGKLQILDVLKVKIAAGFNFRTMSPIWQYRVTTKWNQDDHHALHKTTVFSGGRLQVVPNFDIEYSLPSVGGGSGGGTETESGSCHLKMPRIDCLFNLDETPEIQNSSFFREESILQESSGNGLIEEIPIIKLPEQNEVSQTTKWSSRDLFVRENSLENDIKKPNQSFSQSNSKQIKPVPWGNKNPLKFPWITPDQWYSTEEPEYSDSGNNEINRKQDRRKIWGLDIRQNFPNFA